MKRGGTTVYDQTTKTATFAVNGVYPPGKKITVKVQAKSFYNQAQQMWTDYSYSFTTQTLQPISILIKQEGKTKKKVKIRKISKKDLV